MVETATAPLTGKALLQKIKGSDLPRRELAKLCGYYTVSKGGDTRINLAEFYDSVLAAKGIELEKSKADGRGREASYRASVHKNGSIVIGANYTKEMGLKPGDEFEIKLGYKHIRLIQIDGDLTDIGTDDEGDEEDGEE
ncbi:AbrB family transcriptional regulator [Kamptonema sp. UHCC 0994]|uniref:AbrB family transcriptional regulator n=1 Tax=Kamptonema sp. UHCC 0994 TaxID=3031329 RepID=UPI0023B93E4B|nr:AbrB family transcriptional regulator [Kamptonema sp. UHCC 0994]MDF0554492.1 AbrB family transcriptional regulator [Kamptonema sp. UHCC 0994]